MPKQASPAKRLYTLLVVGVLLSLFGMQSFTPIAHAETANNIQVTPNNSTVVAGDQATFTVSFSCNNPTGCAGAKVTVPMPVVNGSELSPLRYVTGTAANSGYSSSPVYNGTQNTITWTLGNNVGVGTSGAMTFTIQTTGKVIPNGSTVTPSATFALADGSQSLTKTATQPLTITSTSDLRVEKRLLNNAAPLPVDGIASYQVTALHSQNYGPNTGRVENNIDRGIEGYAQLSLSDTHAPGSEFVRATLADGTWVTKEEAIAAGYYDEATRTFTWPDFNELGINTSTGMYLPVRAPYYFIDIRYPDAAFDGGQKVTNTANASATTLSGTPLTGTSSVSHVLATTTRDGGSVYKGSPLLRSNGTTTMYRWVDTGARSSFDFVAINTGATPLTAYFGDSLPCLMTSPDTKDGVCDTPLMTNVSFVFYNAPKDLVLDWITNAGTTGSYTVPGSYDVRNMPISQAQMGVPAGENITRFEATSEVPAGFTLSFNVIGTLPSTQPSSAPVEDYNGVEAKALVKQGYNIVENTMDLNSGLYRGEITDDAANRVIAPSADVTSSREKGYNGYLLFKPETPKFSVTKGMAPSANQNSVNTVTLTTNTQAKVTFTMMGQRSPVDVHPVVTDLLPLGMTYVEGSIKTPENRLSQFPDEFRKVEVIDDFNGTGRQLVRFSWPGAPGIPAGETMRFDQWSFMVNVAGDTPVGATVNEIMAFDANYRNYNTLASPQQCLHPSSESRVDTTNQLGLETADPANLGCISRVNIIIAPTGAMDLEKLVKNQSTDSEYRSSKEWQGTDANGNEVPVGTKPIAELNNGEVAEYILRITNSGNTNLQNIVAYDMLPFINDRGVIRTSEPRNSEWSSTLTKPVEVPAGVTVEYTTSIDACRGEIAGAGYQAQTSAPTGCVNDWSTTAPADLSTVKGLRFTASTLSLAPGEVLDIPITVSAKDSKGGIAWNSFAAVSKSVAGPGSTPVTVLPIETETVGLVVPVNLNINKRVATVNGEPYDPATHSFIKIGDTITWEIKVHNPGPGWATLLNSTDLIPQGMNFETAKITDNTGNPITGSEFNAATGTWSFPAGFKLRPEAPGENLDPFTPDELAVPYEAYLKLTAVVGEGTEGTRICNTATTRSLEYGERESASSETCFTVGVNLSGTIWHDVNADGTIGAETPENRLAGVTVELVDAEGKVVATTTTAANGSYTFTGVPAGNYKIRAVDIPAEYSINTFDADGIDSVREISVTVSNQNVTDQNFGVAKQVEPTAASAVDAQLSRVYGWDFEKTLVSKSLNDATNPVTEYQIKTTELAPEQASHIYEGTVTVTNNNAAGTNPGTGAAPIEATLASVSSTLFGECTVTGQNPVTLNGGASAAISFDCDVPADYTGDLVDTINYEITYSDGRAATTGSKEITGTITEFNKNVTVTDPAATTKSWNYTWNATGTEHTETVQWVDTNRTVQGKCVAVENAAQLSVSGDQAHAGKRGNASSVVTTQLCNGQISGSIFLDQDRDGANLADSPLYTGAVTVELVDAEGNVVATVESTNGTYTFNNVREGDYQVRFVFPEAAKIGVTPGVNTDGANVGNPGNTDAGSTDPLARTVTTPVFTLGGENNVANIPTVDTAVFTWNPVTASSAITGTGAYFNSYTWEVNKSVDAARDNVAVNELGVAQFTVSVSHSKAIFNSLGEATYNGTITLKNPEAVDVTLSNLKLAAAGLECAPIDGVTIPANGSLELNIECSAAELLGGLGSEAAVKEALAAVKFTLTADSNRTNAVTFTFNTGETVVNHDAAQDVDTSVEVRDSFVGAAGEINNRVLGTATIEGENPAVFTYNQSVTPTPGVCDTYTNTATIFAGTEAKDNAAVDYTVCANGETVTSATVNATFDRIYGWDLEKEAVAQTQDHEARTASVDYTITTTELDPTEAGYTYSGEIVVDNQDSDQTTPWIVNVTATSANGFVCEVVDGNNLQIPGGTTATLGFNCEVPSTYTGDLVDTLTISVVRGDNSGQPEVIGTYEVSGTEIPYNETVKVSDPKANFEAEYTWSAAGTEHVENVTWNVTDVTWPELGACVALTNEATLTATGAGKYADQAAATASATKYLCAASVSGQVFLDADRDGSELDTPYTGPVTVYLLDEAGNIVASQPAVNGAYNFINVPVGNYKVRFELHSNEVAYTPQVNTDGSVIEGEGVSDAGATTDEPTTRIIETPLFNVNNERVQIPNVDAAVYNWAPVEFADGASVEITGLYGWDYAWDITKSVDPTTGELVKGDSLDANYTVTVTSSRVTTAAEATVTVNATVVNREAREATVNSLVVTGAQCETPEVGTLAPGASAELSFNCVIDPAALAQFTNVEELAKYLSQQVLTMQVITADTVASDNSRSLELSDSTVELTADPQRDVRAIAKVTDVLTAPDGTKTEKVLEESLHGADALEGKVYTYTSALQKLTESTESYVNTATVSGDGFDPVSDNAAVELSHKVIAVPPTEQVKQNQVKSLSLTGFESNSLLALIVVLLVSGGVIVRKGQQR